MTATPIPRTLGQVLYADLDVSDLRTPPAGRVPIRTGIRRPDELEGTWEQGARGGGRGPPDVRGRAAHRRGRQRRATATDGPRTTSCRRGRRAPGRRGRGEYGSRSSLAPLRVGLVHGRLKPADRDARDGALPRRRPRRARGHDRRRGRRRRARGDDDGHRGRRPVRARPAPPAPWPRRPRHGGELLRARLRGRRGDGRAGAAQGGRRDDATGSRWRSATSSCGARATCWAWRRAACRGCASRRSRTPTTGTLAARARGHAETLVGEDGEAPADPALAARAREAAGWRACSRAIRRAPRERRTGERRRWLTPARVIAGTRAGHPARGARDGDAAAHRPREADAVRGPRARPRGRRASSTCTRAAARGHRGAVARRGARGPRGEGRRAPAGRSRRTCAATRLEADARVVRRDVVTLARGSGGRAPPTRPFDLVLVDPPYADTTGLVRALEARRPARPRRGSASSRSTSGGTRRPRGSGMLASERERRFGETALTFYRRTDEEAGEA